MEASFSSLNRQKLKLKGYTDASIASNKDDSKSISGYIFTLNGGAVSWKSSKQATVVDSTTEAEYITASDTFAKYVWTSSVILVPLIEQ